MCFKEIFFTCLKSFRRIETSTLTFDSFQEWVFLSRKFFLPQSRRISSEICWIGHCYWANATAKCSLMSKSSISLAPQDERLRTLKTIALCSKSNWVALQHESIWAKFKSWRNDHVIEHKVDNLKTVVFIGFFVLKDNSHGPNQVLSCNHWVYSTVIGRIILLLFVYSAETWCGHKQCDSILRPQLFDPDIAA